MVDCASYEVKLKLKFPLFVTVFVFSGGDEFEDAEMMGGGDDEDGGWDVGDDDLELPADLVSAHQNYV